MMEPLQFSYYSSRSAPKQNLVADTRTQPWYSSNHASNHQFSFVPLGGMMRVPTASHSSELTKLTSNASVKPQAGTMGSTSSSEYDSDYSSSSEDEKPNTAKVASETTSTMTKKRANATLDDFGCGCGGEKKKNKKKKKKTTDGVAQSGTVMTSNAAKPKKKKAYTSDSSSDGGGEKHPAEGVIRRASDGKHDYYVYYKGRKISFGDASMPNKNHSDKHRKNFNSRHNCADKHDKTKAGYWACKVWRKGYRGPD